MEHFSQQRTRHIQHIEPYAQTLDGLECGQRREAFGAPRNTRVQVLATGIISVTCSRRWACIRGAGLIASSALELSQSVATPFTTCRSARASSASAPASLATEVSRSQRRSWRPSRLDLRRNRRRHSGRVPHGVLRPPSSCFCGAAKSKYSFTPRRAGSTCGRATLPLRLGAEVFATADRQRSASSYVPSASNTSWTHDRWRSQTRSARSRLGVASMWCFEFVGWRVHSRQPGRARRGWALPGTRQTVILTVETAADRRPDVRYHAFMTLALTRWPITVSCAR